MKPSQKITNKMAGKNKSEEKEWKYRTNRIQKTIWQQPYCHIFIINLNINRINS